MLLYQQAVTDRKQSDVERVLELLKTGWINMSDIEKEEWSKGLKGALNRSDLERIQNNIRLLAEVLEIELVVSDVPELPTILFFDEIRENTEIIRNAYMVHSTTPLVPEHPLNDVSKWNDIELILDDVYGIILNNFSYYCGTEIYAGDETGLLL